ncbi:MAG: hypothetical protein AAF611_07780 [Bacteroidota bacterium]
MVTFGFFGSSSDDIAAEYEKLVDKILIQIFQQHTEVRIITGGYDGFMKSICKRAKLLVNKKFKKVNLETFGILYNGFDEQPNPYMDTTITTNNIGERAQSVIELSDFLFGMPGSQGTQHEILQAMEVIKYPSPDFNRFLKNNLFISSYWNNVINSGEWIFFDENYKFDFKKQETEIQPINFTHIGTDKSEIIDSIKYFISNDKSSNEVLAFDFAFSIYSQKPLVDIGINNSKAIHKYKSIVDDYLLNNASLLGYNTGFRGYKSLNSPKYFTENPKLENYEISFSRASHTKQNRQNIKYGFDDWNKHLEKFKFGKISFWVNHSFLLERKIQVNLSCFLILNLNLPKRKCNHILMMLEKHILDSGLKKIILELDGYITTTEDLISFRDYAAAHKHTIKNYTFRHGLTSLLKYLPKDNLYAQELLENIKNTILIRDLATQLFYSFDNKNSEDCYKDYPIKTISELILTIHKSSSLAYKNFEFLNLDGDCLNEHICNPIRPKDFLDIFNIINNLYSNTRVHSDDKIFNINVDSSKKDKLLITFETLSDLAKPYIDYINDLTPDTITNYHKGFRQIKESQKKLNYIVIEANSSNKGTTIKLIIYESTDN